MELNRVGNHVTFEKQIDILLSQEDAEVIYFAEDDYFYLPAQFSILVKFLNSRPDVHFVSPYDHPDCFRMELHRGTTSLAMCEGHYWSSAASACLTFLTTQATLQKTQHIFRTYAQGNHDSVVVAQPEQTSSFQRFEILALCGQQRDRPQASIMARAWLHGWRQILFGRRWSLWMPIPGIATHLDAGAIPTSIDWLSTITREVEALRAPTFQNE
mgnify:CR=1 FL=1